MGESGADSMWLVCCKHKTHAVFGVGLPIATGTEFWVIVKDILSPVGLVAVYIE